MILVSYTFFFLYLKKLNKLIDIVFDIDYISCGYLIKLLLKRMKTHMEGKAMTFDKVKEVITETLSFDGDMITMESDFANDLKADSLDLVELSMALEENFGIKIPDEEMPKLHTVGDVVNYIDGHKAA